MTDAQREEVRRALSLEDGREIAAAIDTFTHAEQLHQFLANYDVNDGMLPCLAIARHARCDRGTAVWLYFQFADLIGDAEERARQRENEPEWNADAVMSALEDRFATSRFASSEIHFDPSEWLGGGEEYLRRLVARGLREDLVRPVGTRRVEREWLL